MTEESCLPRRIIVSSLCAFALFVNFVIRVMMSVAVIPICDEQSWGDNIKGLILSSFYWGYITTQFPSVWLIRRFGTKIVLGTGLFFASVFSLVLPFVSFSLPGILVVRIITGIAEGVSIPGVYGMAGEWVPQYEKSLTVSCFQASASLGTVFAMGVGPQILFNVGWKWCLWVSGLLGVLWTCLWVALITNSPQDTTSFTIAPIGEAEKNYILSSLDKPVVVEGEAQEGVEQSTPWKALLTHPAVLVLMWNHFASNWGTYLFISWLPTYLKDVLHYDMDSIGMLFSIVPYLTQPVIGISTGLVADFLYKNHYFELTALRKWFQCKACFLAGCGLVILAFTDLSEVLRLILVLCTIASTGFGLGGGYAVNFLDLSGSHSGAIMGISNTFATIPGIAGVYITGYLKEATGGWEAAFILGAAVEVSAMYSFMIWGSAKQIDFNPPDDDQIWLENTETTTNERGEDRSMPNESSRLDVRKVI